MKHTMITVGASIATVTPVFASGGAEAAGTGLLTGIFIAFGILIVLCQLVPGAVLFCSLIKELVGHPVKKSLPATGR